MATAKKKNALKKSSPPKGKFPVDAEKINRIKSHFHNINQQRLLRTREAIIERQRAFIDLLPLLFHINHPLLPGYQSDDTITGIPSYTPDKNTIEVAQNMSRGFKFVNKLHSSYEILALYLMGSSGTIAYTKKSDFDVWLCIRSSVTSEQREELQRKADAIEKWAWGLKLETHFFIMNDEEFRKGELSSLSEDSSGTAQYYLLLDEFYRTSLLVAGLPPVWQIVPAQYESQYDEYVDDLVKRQLLDPTDFLDFGGITEFPVGEFFGAALWQLHKAIDSPHKAVLKIILMEAYASAYPEVDILSLSYKKMVHEGEIDIDRLDPYVLMEKRTEQYLIKEGDVNRIELNRRCFYYKVDRQLSKTNLNKTWQHEAIKKIAKEWGWGGSQFKVLDSRPSWKINQIIEERNALIASLTQSYQLLSAFAREHSEVLTIGPEEINLLGRRLYSAFERKPGKIDIVNPKGKLDLSEERLSLHQVRNKSQQSWVLHQGYVPSLSNLKTPPLKRSHNILEILAWVYFNRVLNTKGTVVSLKPDDCSISKNELQAIIASLEYMYPKSKIPDINMDDLAKPVKIKKTSIIINIGRDPMHSLTQKGVVLLSDRTDALNFSSRYENLALSFDQIIITSWQEVLVISHGGSDALAKCVCDTFSRYPTNENMLPPTPSCFSFSSKQGASISKRVELLFKDIRSYYYKKGPQPHARYIYQAGRIYYVLQPEEGIIKYTRTGSFNALLDHLSMPQNEFSPIYIDRHILHDTPLPKIFALNQADHVQVFYQLINDSAQIYILDEQGALFHQKIFFYDHASLLGQLYRFLGNVSNRHALSSQLDSEKTVAPESDFYQITLDAKKKIHIKPKPIHAKQLSRNFLDIQVISDIQDDGQTNFTLYCNKKEFNSLEHGEQLFNNVAEYVLNIRDSGLPYPIHITDIDISNTGLTTGTSSRIQTIHYLNYKKRIENMLNHALKNLQF